MIWKNRKEENNRSPLILSRGGHCFLVCCISLRFLKKVNICPILPFSPFNFLSTAYYIFHIPLSIFKGTTSNVCKLFLLGESIIYLTDHFLSNSEVVLFIYSPFIKLNTLLLSTTYASLEHSYQCCMP